jgi:hypothetical protein
MYVSFSKNGSTALLADFNGFDSARPIRMSVEVLAICIVSDRLKTPFLVRLLTGLG